MIPVGHLSPFDQWDQALVTDLLDGLKCRWHRGYPNTKGACVVLLAGRYWAGSEDQITTAIKRYAAVLLIVTGDEEALFNHDAVTHPNLRRWIQTPRQGKEYPPARFFGVGYTPHMRSLPKDPPQKNLDLFMSCQRTHTRRIEAFEALKETPLEACVIPTEGFTQGLPAVEYAANMIEAKVAPAPSGAVSPDSFRFWEALEAHAIPIADTVSPVDGITDYWARVCPDAPFPILTDYASLPGYINDHLEMWPANANRVAAWWMQQRRRYARWLREDLEALGAL